MSFSHIPFKYDKNLYNKAEKLQHAYYTDGGDVSDFMAILFNGSHILAYLGRMLIWWMVLTLCYFIIWAIFNKLFSGSFHEYLLYVGGGSVVLTIILPMYAKFADKIYWFFGVLTRPFRKIALASIYNKQLLTTIYAEEPSFKLCYVIKELIYDNNVEYWPLFKIRDANVYIRNNGTLKTFNTPEQVDDYIKELVKESKQLAAEKLQTEREKYDTELQNNYKFLNKRLQYNKECNIKKYI